MNLLNLGWLLKRFITKRNVGRIPGGPTGNRTREPLNTRERDDSQYATEESVF